MVGLNGTSESTGQPAQATMAWAEGEAWPETVEALLRLIQVGESVAPGGAAAAAAAAKKDKEDEKEPCRRIYLHAFYGEKRMAPFRQFMRSLDYNRDNSLMGPTAIEIQMIAGHVGLSFEARAPIYGFNPKPNKGEAGWQVFDNMQKPVGSHQPYPGVIKNDTGVFAEAQRRGLPYKVVEYIYPKSKYDEILAKFKKAKRSTGLTYSFPGRGGDCNCATWPGRIGIPIPHPSGHMYDYITEIRDPDIRPMGDCDDG